MKLLRYNICALAVLMALLLSCRETPPDEPAKHLLLVYMVGDNNLNNYTLEKIEALQRGFLASPGNKLLIYNDSGFAPSLIEIVNKKGSNIKHHVNSYGDDTNSANPAVLARIIDEVKTKYPAQSYGLILFSHASGWLPKGYLTTPRSISDARTIFQDKQSEMELPNFSAAIPDHLFNYIVIEACYMAGIEVAYELKDKADYIVASSAEIVDPGFMYAYEHGINLLFSAPPNLSLLSLFTELAYNYLNQTTNSDSEYGKSLNSSATFSIIKTGEIENLVAFVRDNCDWSRHINFSRVQDFGRTKDRNLFFDFEGVYSQLLPTDEQQRELSRLISKCVVKKYATNYFFGNLPDGFKIDYHSGLSTYAPQNLFPELNEKYTKTKWHNTIRPTQPNN